MGILAIWHSIYELRPLNDMNLQTHVIKPTNAHVYNMFLSHVCAFFYFVTWACKDLESTDTENECTLQPVCVCVSRLLYLYELPLDRSNRATSSS
jgi:hypothetical protein